MLSEDQELKGKAIHLGICIIFNRKISVINDGQIK